MNALFCVIGLGAGAYCLYAYVMMRTKKEINKTILLPKDVALPKCKDMDGYIRETSMPLLALGMMLVIYGAIEAVNQYVYNIGKGILAVLFAVAAVLIWFSVRIRKVNKKYFGI